MRSTSLTHWALFSAPLLLILALLWLGFGTEQHADLYFKEYRTLHPVLREIMQFITNWANPVFYVGYGLTLLTAYKKHNRARVRSILILLAVQLVVAGLCVHFTKWVIGRPRPNEGHWYAPLSGKGTQHSLPSGHTTELTGWSLPLALHCKKYWLSALLGVLIGLLGFSRVFLGWHHPTDVFFGWLLGSFGGFATMVLVQSTLFSGKKSHE